MKNKNIEIDMKLMDNLYGIMYEELNMELGDILNIRLNESLFNDMIGELDIQISEQVLKSVNSPTVNNPN